MSDPVEVSMVEHAQAIIVAAFPRFRGMDVVLLDEGYDFKVFELESRWLFRFPKREESVAKLNREHRLLPDLGKSAPLPVPSYECFCESSEPSGRPFAGYRKLPGIPGDQAEFVDPSLVAQQIGGFLDTLHAYPVGRAGEAGVVETRDLVAHWRTGLLRGWTELLESMKTCATYAVISKTNGRRLSKRLRRSSIMTCGPSIFS